MAFAVATLTNTLIWAALTYTLNPDHPLEQVAVLGIAALIGGPVGVGMVTRLAPTITKIICVADRSGRGN